MVNISYERYDDFHYKMYTTKYTSCTAHAGRNFKNKDISRMQEEKYFMPFITHIVYRDSVSELCNVHAYRATHMRRNWHIH